MTCVPPTTFVELLRWRSWCEPARCAFSFLPDGAPHGPALDYAELDRQARAIGALLQARGSVGNRALLVYPPGLAFVAALFGCLYAGWLAVPVSPPAPKQLSRLRAMARDARPAAALTSQATLARVTRTPRLADEPDVPDVAWLCTDPDVAWLCTDALPDGLADAWQERRVAPDDLAVLQYTSGSTAAPRGVMLSHANLLHNTRQIERRFAIDGASRGVIWLPPFHDMGLIGGILQAVEVGVPVALMSPSSFLQRPARWLEAVARERATVSGGPNFAYDLCVDRVAAEERATLDLSSWQVAFNGAEPVRRPTLERFVAAFAPCGFRREAFYPCYGLAEATLMVAGGERSRPPSVLTLDAAALARGDVVVVPETGAARVDAVSCGPVIDGQRLVIVDPATRTACPPGRLGEIWVAGPSVAQGYWQQPDLTHETFDAWLADSHDGPFLRTGDLGFLDSGELYVTGRLKTLLIVGGRNVQAEDIEQTVASSHPAGWPGGVAAVSVEDGGRERLVVFQEVGPRRGWRDGDRDLDGVVRAIRLAVAEQHQLPIAAVVLMRPGSIPRTSSGKVRRHACREAFLTGHLGDVLFEWRLTGGARRP